MKILICSKFNDTELIDSSFVPRIGENVDLFYKPMPTVVKVICHPSDETVKQFTLSYLAFKIEAIVFVE